MAVNDSLIITSSPTAYIDQGSAYNYVITSIDEEGDPIAYDVSKPDWLSWDPVSDTVWSLTQSEAGTYTIEVRASDDYGAEHTQAFTLSALNVNDSLMGYLIWPCQTVPRAIRACLI